MRKVSLEFSVGITIPMPPSLAESVNSCNSVLHGNLWAVRLGKSTFFMISSSNLRFRSMFDRIKTTGCAVYGCRWKMRHVAGLKQLRKAI